MYSQIANDITQDYYQQYFPNLKFCTFASVSI